MFFSYGYDVLFLMYICVIGQINDCFINLLKDILNSRHLFLDLQLNLNGFAHLRQKLLTPRRRSLN